MQNVLNQTPQQVDTTIGRALQWSYDHLDPEGFWVGLLETNCTMEAEWVLGMHFLGVQNDPKLPGVLKNIRQAQRPDGAWQVYYGSVDGDMNATVESYAALRCAGDPPDAPHMSKAREWILSHGGVKKVRNFTKIWLAMVGEWPWDGTPTLPPEIIYFPDWFTFTLDNFASWARATMVPLCIVSARRPVRPFPEGRRMDELFPNGRGPKETGLPKPAPGGWNQFFFQADKVLRAYGKQKFKPLREQAIKLCLQWIHERQEADGSWAGIQPPWIYSLMALSTEGYPLSHPTLREGVEAFNRRWSVEDPRGTFIQACNSPIWDTLLTQLAMLDCGVACEEKHFLKSLDWILSKQIFRPGDWSHRSPDLEPGAWAFEFYNDWYPDVDDTAVALIVLARAAESHPEPARVRAMLERALRWTLGMRSKNGAWAAFDKDNWTELIRCIPFCDFGEVLDPPSADVTAHVVEALGWLGRGMEDPYVAGAVDYLRREQEEDGSWFGRWGVNHIYGTGAVLPALEKVGENMRSDYVRKACTFLLERQNPDGGWGESCASYMDKAQRGRGPSTASQTGWALMALVATHNPEYREAIERGVAYLHATQNAEGSWDELYFTGTGFPGYGGGARTNGRVLNQGKELGRGFMLRYHMYRHYFPLMALGRARDYFRKHGA